MNFSDLFVVIVLVSGMYAVLVAIAGQRNFLLKAVNPNRLHWFLAGLSVLWVGFSFMRWEAQNWNLSTWSRLFSQLISEEPTSPRVKMASVAIFLGLTLIGVVIYCMLAFPRDPSSFKLPRDRREAFNYYVGKVSGGLDYAVLTLGDGEILEEKVNSRQVKAWCVNLPKIQMNGDPPRHRTFEDQVELWRKLALQINARMGDLNQLLEVAQQGHNRHILFDCEYGGIFFHYIRLPDVSKPLDTSLFLLGASLNQREMDSGRADQQFRLLLAALNHIDRSVRVV
ncbi:MAG: hypothetical protein ACKO23_14190 [Gemmataceae bacterium]